MSGWQAWKAGLYRRAMFHTGGSTRVLRKLRANDGEQPAVAMATS